MKARASICVAAIGMATGLACAGIGDPVLCFEQMWVGITQFEDLGGERCKTYTNCPKEIRCLAGRVNLRIARTESMQVTCQTFGGGTWDPVKGRCVGGDLDDPQQMSDEIKVEVCLDGCN